MSESWNDHADNWDDNPDVILYAERAFDSLRDQINPSSLQILDFGCGTGLLTEKLSQCGAHVTAIDPAQKMIDVLNAKALKNVTVMCTSVNQDFLNSHSNLSESFDMIVASSVFAFVPDYPSTLSVLSKLLKPGGHLLQWDWEKHDDFGFDQNIIKAAHKQAGLTTVDIHTPFSMSNQSGSLNVIMGMAKKV